MTVGGLMRPETNATLIERCYRKRARRRRSRAFKIGKEFSGGIYANPIHLFSIGRFCFSSAVCDRENVQNRSQPCLRQNENARRRVGWNRQRRRQGTQDKRSLQNDF